MRVVIDTNVVLSALLFRSAATSPLTRLRLQWERGRIMPVVCRESAEELLRVLAYPKFQLTEAEQQQVLAAYLPFCETHSIRLSMVQRARLPACRDPQDQIYLELAASAKVAAVITGDRDLLALKGDVAFRILTPADWMKSEPTSV